MRFTRTGGKNTNVVRTPLPLNVRKDTVYEIRIQAHGTDFTAMVNDKIVDVWSDPTHARGGVGFWADAGEAASIRYARLSERDDLTGRVLADILEPADKK